LTSEAISIFPKLSFLSSEYKDRIYRAALHVIENIGMEIQHESALTMLLNAGCSVKSGQMVTIPGSLVEQSIQSAPGAIPVFNRNGRQVMDLGGNRSYFGTGSDLIYSLNSSDERHLCILDDVRRAPGSAMRLPISTLSCRLPIPMTLTPQGPIWSSFRPWPKIPLNPLSVSRNAEKT